MNKSYANRGQPFEDLIKLANNRYAQMKLAVINKQATEFIPIRDRNGKICSVKVEHKSTVDFIGRWKQYPIAIEAKHTSDNTIRWDAVQPHQADYMDAFTAQPGTIGVVLISFNMERFFMVPWTFWQAAYNARVRPGAHWRTPVTVSAFRTTWNIPKKKSVRIEELDPSWEIPKGDVTYGFHYLRKAELYITPPH